MGRVPRYSPPVPNPTDYLRLVADPIRLAVLGHAAAGPVDVPALSSALGVGEREVLGAVGRLREAGLLTAELELDKLALRGIGESLPVMEAASVADGPWTGDEVDVLSRFFEGSRLTQIPAARAKRIVVLERLALEFEPGIRYPERQVNSILVVFHPDYAALRRYMVDEGLLTRADGSYWRSGGRLDT